MKRLFPVIYMFAVTAVLSAVIIGFAQMTSDRVEANQQIAFERAIYSIIPRSKSTIDEHFDLHEFFQNEVEKPSPETGGAYVHRENGKINVYILPFEGQGFWAPIKGVISIRADKKTVIGMVIYQQRETPGLGAEIAEFPFIRQFFMLVIADDEKLINFRRPGEKLKDNEVHAVTGATQTSTRLEKIINDALVEWRGKVKSD